MPRSFGKFVIIPCMAFIWRTTLSCCRDHEAPMNDSTRLSGSAVNLRHYATFEGMPSVRPQATVPPPPPPVNNEK